MASQKQLWAAIESARARGWSRVNGNTLGAPSNNEELPTPKGVPSRWWEWPTYHRLLSVSFVLSRNAKGEPRISAAFVRVHRSPWVNAEERKVTFNEAIEVLGRE